MSTALSTPESCDPDPKHRTGFPPFDRWIEAWRGAHEMPGLYPDALDPKERMRALQQSSFGNLKKAAILTREARTEWGSAFGALSTVTESLLAKPQIWQGPPEIVNVLRGTSERTGIVDKLIPETEEAEILKTAVTLGVGVGRLSACTIRGRTMRSLTAWDAEHLRYEWQPDVWRIATNKGEEWADIEEGAWVLCLPYGDKFPWKRAPWKAITLSYTFARDAWFQESRYAQNVHPVRIGTANESSNPKQRASFIDYLKAARFDPWLLLRPGETFDIKGTTGGDKMGEIFEQIDARCRREVITCIKGETSTTDGGKGFASDATQAEISADKMAFYARALSRFESEILGWAAYDLTGVDPWDVGIVRTFDATTRASRLADINALKAAGEALEKVTAGTKGIDHRPVLHDVIATFGALGWRIEPVPPKAGPEQAAFNGAQVTAAAAIVAAVAGGQTPRDAGIGQLKALFNLDDAQAQSMMGTAGAGFHPAAAQRDTRLKYDPNQSRADDGKFGSGAGSSKGDGDKSGGKEPSKGDKPSEPSKDSDKPADKPEPAKDPATPKDPAKPETGKEPKPADKALQERAAAEAHKAAATYEASLPELKTRVESSTTTEREIEQKLDTWEERFDHATDAETKAEETWLAHEDKLEELRDAKAPKEQIDAKVAEAKAAKLEHKTASETAADVEQEKEDLRTELEHARVERREAQAEHDHHADMARLHQEHAKLIASGQYREGLINNIKQADESVANAKALWQAKADQMTQLSDQMASLRNEQRAIYQEQQRLFGETSKHGGSYNRALMDHPTTSAAEALSEKRETFARAYEAVREQRDNAHPAVQRARDEANYWKTMASNVAMFRNG